jgi:hypothetical protein
MKKGLIIAVILLAAVMFISGINGCEQTISECQSDNDCAKVQTTCCPCSMGGNEECVLKSNLTDYQPNCQKTPICAAMFNCKNITCACEDKKCKTIKG